MAFRSERAGGGIYVVPSLGGEEVLLAPRGRGPRFSPDGRWIAYWEGRESADVLPGTARVFVIESGGGQARQIGSDLAAALYPVWSPSGNEVLVLGRHPSRGEDWWAVPVQAGPSRQTGAFAALAAQRLVFTAWLTDILPLEWRASGRVIFAAGPGDAGNLWEIALSGGRVQGTRHAPHARSRIPVARLLRGGRRPRAPSVFQSRSGSPRSGASRSTRTAASPKANLPSSPATSPHRWRPPSPPTVVPSSTSATTSVPARCARAI